MKDAAPEEPQVPPPEKDSPRPGKPALKRPKEPSAPPVSACYVDYENLFYGVKKQSYTLNVPRLVRGLNRITRGMGGEGFFKTAVYANWDALVPEHRRAQDDWALVGWRTVAVPSKEDYWSGRPVKNLVDFVMSLDIVEDAHVTPISHFFILSGDNDFVEAIERVRRLGKKSVVMSLQPNLSFRLQEAADEFVILNIEEITGSEPPPIDTYGRGRIVPRLSLKKRQGESVDHFQALRMAIEEAQRDQNTPSVPWSVVRDEYFLRVVSMTVEEANRFLEMVSGAGYVEAARRSVAGIGAVLYIKLSKI
ncbi:MAG: NYN domain-containing protein [Candidatus Eremiobacteraeota bacterium]|nr:NYN domain-containing protein [Candidatus Eremiobacteraeota bacterium]